MDEKKLRDFEEKLLREKEKILREKSYVDDILKKSPREASGEISGYRTHIADLGGDTYQKEMASKLTTQESQILIKIETALRKIREGKYGNCEKCGKKIEMERLEVIPYAQLCIKCQKELEAKKR